MRCSAAICVTLIGFLAWAAVAESATPDELLLCNTPDHAITQPDGSILVLGQTMAGCDSFEETSRGSPDRFLTLVKLTSGGTVDGAFGQGGVLLLPVASGESPTNLISAGEGRTVVATTDSLRRVAPDGRPDSSFGTNGAVTNFDSTRPAVAAAIDANGNIVVASPQLDGTTKVIRFGEGGQRDGSFGTDGVSLVNYTSRGTGLAIDDAGRVILTDGDSAFRLLPDGTPDVAFGPNGDGSAPGLPLPLGVNSVADVTVDPGGKIRIYGEMSDFQYRYNGFREVIDDSGDPVAEGSGAFGGYLHAGHAFAEMPGGDVAFTVLPSRGEASSFSFSRESLLGVRDPVELEISPGAAAAILISTQPDGSLLVGGTGSDLYCGNNCNQRQYSAIVKIDPSTNLPDPLFGVGGTTLVPGNPCSRGVGPVPAGQTDRAWNRCRVKPPTVRAKVRIRHARSRKPAIRGTVRLGAPPSVPYFLTQRVKVRLPAHLKIRKRKLRVRTFARGYPLGASPLKSVNGRTLTFTVSVPSGDYDPFSSETPVNRSLRLKFGIKPGAIRRIPAKLRHRKLNFRVTGTYLPVDYQGDENDRSPWYAGNKASITTKVRPAARWPGRRK